MYESCFRLTYIKSQSLHKMFRQGCLMQDHPGLVALCKGIRKSVYYVCFQFHASQIIFPLRSEDIHHFAALHHLK